MIKNFMEVRHAVRKISELRVNPSNPRVIRDKRFKELKASIEQDPKMMEARPLCVSMHPDRLNMIVGGNQRYQAVKSLGWKEVSVAELYDGTEEEEKRWMLKDNQSWGEHDWDKLANEYDLDFLKSVGFDEKELDKILGKQDHSKDDEFDAEAVAEAIKEPITKRGDIWQLGRHYLMCGDSTKKEDVERLMDGKKADMVFTDPPYGVSYDGGVFTKREQIQGDNTTGLYDPCCLMAYEFSKDEAPLYLWLAATKTYIAAAAAAAAGYEIRCEIIWNKNHAQFGALSSQYKQKHEPCFYCFKIGKTVNWSGPTNEVTIWDIDRASKNDFHPTQKPIALAVRAMTNHTAKSVLDLFGGSGSTLIACEQTGRTCYMMEISEVYCDVIINRFEAKTGIKAVKVG